MIAVKVARAICIVVSCLALALAGVTGVHAHLASGHAPAHSHVSPAPARLVAFIDGEHLRAHEINGEIDIEPTTKAFGKFLQASLPLALTFVVLIARPTAHPRGPIHRRSTPHRPPRNRLRLGLLPPSNAPPPLAL